MYLRRPPEGAFLLGALSSYSSHSPAHALGNGKTQRSWQGPHHGDDETILPTRDDEKIVALERAQGFSDHKIRIEPQEFGDQRPLHAQYVVKLRHGISRTQRLDAHLRP